MANEPVLTLALEGPDISLASFATAITSFQSLLAALGSEVAPSSSLAWKIQSLENGSAITTVRGELLSGDPGDLDRVSAAYEVVAGALASGASVPYSPKVARPSAQLVSVLADHVNAIRLETAARDFVVVRELAAAGPPRSRPPVSLGAVEGRIQTLSNRRSVRFTLYDELDDRAVSCYMKPGDEGVIQKFWGLRAVVEGTVGRDFDGRPVTIRDVTDITPLPERGPDDWRNARSALADVWDGTPAEETIRKIRDAWR